MHVLAVPGSLQQPEFHRALPYCPIQATGHLWATLFSPRSKQGHLLYFALAGSFALCLAESNLMLPQRLFFLSWTGHLFCICFIHTQLNCVYGFPSCHASPTQAVYVYVLGGGGKNGG